MRAGVVPRVRKRDLGHPTAEESHAESADGDGDFQVWAF